ncbi:hypothetical protein I0P70_07155 [Pontibacter sp. FD36]|uniref:hypothetical protein n=1 Tax=Pontibacter sp. FD36 TaxID=2789860 RepID=UPI0018AB1122|nr:hypothetical protein [Pontibacter sp. FD36]MBF8963016.1 hypothetical protein [Pontibacter sp. FD36]
MANEASFNNIDIREYIEIIVGKYDWQVYSLYKETLNKIGWEIEVSVCKDKGLPVGDIIEERQFYYETEAEMNEDFRLLDSIAVFD